MLRVSPFWLFNGASIWSQATANKPATPITIDATMPSRDRTTAHAFCHPATITNATPTSTSHNGESWRDSTKRLAATAVDHTSVLRCGDVNGSDASNNTATHSNNAE